MKHPTPSPLGLGLLIVTALAANKKVDGSGFPSGYSFEEGAVGLCALWCVWLRGLLQSDVLPHSSTLAALLFSNLYVFENAFITQFRAAQLYAFQVSGTPLADSISSDDCASSMRSAPC